MIVSKLKLIALLAGLAAILFCAWAKPLDTIAMQRVDEGFKRAIVSFGTARLIGAVISVAQGTDVSMQPAGVGVKFAPGQAFHPIADLLENFADMMLAATVIFGAMKVLLIIGGSSWLSLVITGVTLWWAWFHWRGHPSPLWLSKLAIVLMLLRFSVPVVMVGSDAIFQHFMADGYNSSQSALAATVSELESSPLSQASSNTDVGTWEKMKKWVTTNIDVTARLKAMAKGATRMVDHMINVIVVFLLQTLVIPLLLFWALYRVLMAMFQNSETSRPFFESNGRK
jgi:hypothetical protein